MSALNELVVAAMANGLPPEEYLQARVDWVQREQRELVPQSQEIAVFAHNDWAKIRAKDQMMLASFMMRWGKLNEELEFLARVGAESDFAVAGGLPVLAEGAL